MAVYNCKAISRTGQVVKSKINDNTKQSIIKRLKDNGLTPIYIEKVKTLSLGTAKKEKKNKTGSLASQITMMKDEGNKQENPTLKQIKTLFAKLSGVKRDDIIAFTQSLYLLKKANFTNLRALTTLLENTKNQGMREIIEDILNGVEAGDYIYTTLEYYSKLFPYIYVNMVKVGELSGSLTNALQQAMKYLEDSTRVSKQVKKAIIPALLQTGGLLIGSIGAVIFGLPIMEDLYGQLGVTDQIPPATVAFSNFIKAMGEYWYVTIGVIALLITLFILWKNTPKGKYNWDMFKLRAPIFGPLILRTNLQKFFQSLQLNLKNHARLQEAIEVSKSVTTNYVILSMLETAQNNLQIGESWVAPFEQLSFFPPMILEMLKIGMETDIVEMIDKIVEFVEQDIKVTIEKMIKALPEVSTVIFGIVLVGFTIIVLRPIMEVYLGSFLFEAYDM
jgi:type II secretory pathway component PulF